MRTQLNNPDAFSFVMLQRQAIEDKLMLRNKRKDNHLYAKRNLFWIAIAYAVGVFVLLFF